MVRIGVIGIGRLGRVLATRLSQRFEVVVHDRDAVKVKQFASRRGLALLDPEALIRRCEVIVLCIPGSGVPALIGQLPIGERGHPLFVDTATEPAAYDSTLAPTRIIGLRPVSQFAAIEQGLPALFVTGAESMEDRTLLGTMFDGIGTVIAGDETAVGPLNQLATTAALRLCRDLSSIAAARGIDRRLTDAALKNVAVGTILDYPPDPANAYTNRILDGLPSTEALRERT